MAVQKFRTVEEMGKAAILVANEEPGSRLDRFLRHCARYRSLSPRIYPRGVFRFRSIAEAQEARERVAAETALRRP